MAWKIEMRNGRHAVVKKGSGQLVAMHQNAAAAQAHLKALYANMNEEPKYKKSRTYQTNMARNAVARRVMNGKKTSQNSSKPLMASGTRSYTVGGPTIDNMPKIKPDEPRVKIPKVPGKPSMGIPPGWKLVSKRPVNTGIKGLAGGVADIRKR